MTREQKKEINERLNLLIDFNKTLNNNWQLLKLEEIKHILNSK